MSTEVFQTITDVVDASTTYFCQADPGVATTDPYWSIYKQTTSGGVVTRMYPIGNVNGIGMPTFYPMFRASERAAYTYALTRDVTAPTLSTVTIASNNTVTTLAKVGDTVTITIVASESLGSLTADISTGSGATLYTAPATIVRTSGTSWSASRVMTSSDNDGTVTFRIKFSDVGGTAGTDVTAVTGGSGVTFDETVATITTATMASNNSTTTLAKEGDVVTLTFIASESLTSKPTVTIAGHAIAGGNVTEGIDAAHWTATYTMVSGDSTGLVAFTINGTDLAGNAITPCTALTSGSGVTYDKTAPTAAITYSTNDPVKSGATLTITATFSEAMKDSPVPKIEISGSNTVAATNMTKVSTTVYTYAHTVGAGNGTATVAMSVGTDLAGNVVTAAPTSGATFTVDNTAPALSSVTETNVTTLNVVLSNAASTASITKANAGGFVVTETSGVPTYAVSSIAPGVDNTHVILTVADMTASAGAGVTVTYVSGGNGTVADLAGNAMATDATGVATWAF